MKNFPKFLLLLASTCCLLLLSATSRGQGTIIVKGKVADQATGNPLSDASIQIKGSKAGTTTDADGNYSINVSRKATLIFSSVGYENLEMPVNGRTVMDVFLEVSTKGLSEVVVVGYGTQKKENITGAVGVIH